jgi:TetR/AcrR family transcriptional regulator, regulator of cefoperazone and chloramphenicol sensitivity
MATRNPTLDDDKTATEPRQRLLIAAEQVFAHKGFVGATVREICDLAGMNIAAINYHFGDKERLYIETVKNAHLASKGIEALPEFPAGVSAIEKLKYLISSMVEHMTAPVRPESVQLLMRELAHPSPATVAVVQEYIQPMAFGLFAILNELLPLMPEKQRLMIGFTIVGQCLYYRQNRTVSELLFGPEAISQLSTEAITQHILRFTLAALGLAGAYPNVVQAEGAL